MSATRCDKIEDKRRTVLERHGEWNLWSSSRSGEK